MTEIHTALGSSSCLFFIQIGGSLYSGIQQGDDPDYYSILIFNYAWVLYASHYPTGWVIKTIQSRN